ncbi:VOC family protein [Actinoplanes sp. CA-030573]|uniref:VOC family protein n=1 Tax=Actinoplanes sp. CA-030573 TaxID=3239898 RepID=UPI003D8A26D3
MIEGLNKIEVITIFAEDLAAARAFYEDVFGLEVVWSDEASAVVRLENLMINVLRADRADTLIEPRAVAGAEAGVRLLPTIAVDDVDAVHEQLKEHGVTILNGPTDRPWGRRTLAFTDPAGNVWEAAQILA